MRAWCRHSRSTAFPATRSNRRYRRRGVDHTPPAFLDPNRIVGQDHRWDYGEDRFQSIGAIESRVFVLVYTLRAATVRIISARKANIREKQTYENNTLES